MIATPVWLVVDNGDIESLASADQFFHTRERGRTITSEHQVLVAKFTCSGHRPRSSSNPTASDVEEVILSILGAAIGGKEKIFYNAHSRFAGGWRCYGEIEGR